MAKRTHLIALAIISLLVGLSSCALPIASASSSDSASSSSSAAGSSSSSLSDSSSDSSLSSSSSSSSEEPAPKVYRVAPHDVAAGETSIGVYDVSWSGSSFVSTLRKTLRESDYCTSYQDVAAYWMGFRKVPPNYFNADGDSSDGKQVSKNAAYQSYGEAARLWFTYHASGGYMSQMPPYNLDGNQPTYYEIDIASSWSSYKRNRGSMRLIGLPYGLVAYGADPAIFYTDDHYDTFSEYYNYQGGWGQAFASQSDYEAPTTVDVSY